MGAWQPTGPGQAQCAQEDPVFSQEGPSPIPPFTLAISTPWQSRSVDFSLLLDLEEEDWVMQGVEEDLQEGLPPELHVFFLQEVLAEQNIQDFNMEGVLGRLRVTCSGATLDTFGWTFHPFMDRQGPGAEAQLVLHRSDMAVKEKPSSPKNQGLFRYGLTFSPFMADTLGDTLVMASRQTPGAGARLAQLVLHRSGSQAVRQ